MARYRKIDVRIWNDRKFRELDDKSKLAFFLVLTHPDTNQLGMLRSRSMSLAMELGWHPDAMSDAISMLCKMGMLMADDRAGFIFIPNFLKYNPPNGPNSVKGWAGLLDQMPECDLLNRAINCLKPFIFGLSDGLQKAIPDDIKDAIRDAIPDDIKDAHRIQEQKQEQDIYNTNKQQSKEVVQGTPIQEKSVCSVEEINSLDISPEIDPVSNPDEHKRFELGDCYDIYDRIDQTTLTADVTPVPYNPYEQTRKKRDDAVIETAEAFIEECKALGINISKTNKVEAFVSQKVTKGMIVEAANRLGAVAVDRPGYFLGTLENVVKESGCRR